MIRSSAAEGVACMAMNGRVEKKDVIGRRRAVRIDMVARARIFVDQQGGLAVLPIVLYVLSILGAAPSRKPPHD